MPSLADELAGELDPNEDFGTGHNNAGLGLSLADELDLDLELDLGDHHHHEASPKSEDGHLAPSLSNPTTQPSGTIKTPSRSMTKKGRASQTSTYYTANASPGRLSALDSADEVDQSLYQLEIGGSGSDASSPDSHNVPDLLEEAEEFGLSSNGDGRYQMKNEAGMPTPNMDEDMIAIIQDQVDDIARFVNSLKQIEPDRTTDTPATSTRAQPLNHSLNRSTTSAPTVNTTAEADTEAVLTRYVNTVGKASDASERNSKEITHIRADLGSIFLSPDQASEMIRVLTREDDLGTPKVHPPSDQGAETAGTVSSPAEADAASAPMDPDESFVTAQDPDLDIPGHQVSPVAEAMNEIITENKNLVSDLSQLSESVHLQQSFQTSTSRQIKGLKSTLLTWKEREEMEERAKVAIEQWERGQVERGLRGDKGTREVLDELMMGFHRTLEDCERRMGAVRAKYAVTAA